MFFIGMYVSLAMYHFLVYLGRREDKNNLYYAIIVISFAYLTFTMSVIPKMTFIEHDIRYNFWHLSIVFSYTAVTASLFFYIIKVLKIEQYKKIAIGFVVLAFIVNSFVYIGSHILKIATFYELSPIMFYCLTPTSCIFYTIVMYNFFKNKNRTKIQTKLTISISFFILFFILHPILLMLDVKEYIAISFSNVGMIITMIIIAKYLVDIFNDEHHELIDTKNNLEKKIEERTFELREAKELIEIQSQEKTNFFVNLAHETRNPAMNILNYLNRCINRYPNDNNLHILRANVNKLVRDMVNFLDSEKIEQGRLFYDDCHSFDLSKFINEKVTFIEPTFELKKICILRKIQDGVDIVSNIYGIDKIVNNLLDNAYKYTDNGGNVEILLDSKEKDQIVLCVRDNGIGIPEEKKKHIFDKYYQITHKKSNYQGIGMGLYITKGIVDSLHGEIEFISPLVNGRGTEFKVTFRSNSTSSNTIPYSETGFDLASQHSIGMSTNDLPIENIIKDRNKDIVLIVEDDKNILFSIKEVLEDEYNILCAINGKEALELIEKHRIILIISDIMMDIMDGYELLRILQNNKKDIPFVFLTSKGGVSEEIKGLSRGAIDYIQKPFEVTALRAKVISIVNYNKLKNKTFELEKYKSIGMLTASICHEILNPLSGISGNMYVVDKEIEKAGLGNAALVDSIKHIKENSNRISEIVTTMRSLFYGKKMPQMMIDISSIINPLINIFKNKVGKRISFEYNNESINIVSDKSAFTQILFNLMANAVDAIREDGVIVIKVASDGRNITIEDNGIGISQDDLVKIYDIGYTTKTNGTGIGLFIVKELCVNLGIVMKIDSIINEGTIVSLDFKNTYNKM